MKLEDWFCFTNVVNGFPGGQCPGATRTCTEQWMTRTLGALSWVNLEVIDVGNYGTNGEDRQEICEDLKKLGRSLFCLFDICFQQSNNNIQKWWRIIGTSTGLPGASLTDYAAYTDWVSRIVYTFCSVTSKFCCLLFIYLHWKFFSADTCFKTKWSPSLTLSVQKVIAIK